MQHVGLLCSLSRMYALCNELRTYAYDNYPVVVIPTLVGIENESFMAGGSHVDLRLGFQISLPGLKQKEDI